jgi:hypothetical protein
MCAIFMITILSPRKAHHMTRTKLELAQLLSKAIAGSRAMQRTAIESYII